MLHKFIIGLLLHLCLNSPPLFNSQEKKCSKNNLGQKYWIKSNKPFILRQVLFILSEYLTI